MNQRRHMERNKRIEPAGESRISCGDLQAGRRRVGGGSDREAGGAAGARPRAPGGRIVFLRGAAAGVGAATGTLGLPDPTAPGGPDPSSIPLGRLSHLSRAPNTDCEVCAVRGRCLPAALSIPLARISEQVPRSWEEAAGRQGGLGAAGWSQASQVQERPGRCQCAVCLAGGEGSRSWGARREEGAAAEPRLCTVGAGSGRLCRPSFCQRSSILLKPQQQSPPQGQHMGEGVPPGA